MSSMPMSAHQQTLFHPAALLSTLVRTTSAGASIWITDWGGLQKLADLSASNKTIQIETGHWYKCWGQSDTLNPAGANATIEAPHGNVVWRSTSSGGMLEAGRIAGLNGSVTGEASSFLAFTIMPDGQTPRPPGPSNGNGNGGGIPPIDPMLILFGIGTLAVLGAALFFTAK